jgi:hypothetical protein
VADTPYHYSYCILSFVVLHVLTFYQIIIVGVMGTIDPG